MDCRVSDYVFGILRHSEALIRADSDCYIYLTHPSLNANPTPTPNPKTNPDPNPNPNPTPNPKSINRLKRLINKKDVEGSLKNNYEPSSYVT